MLVAEHDGGEAIIILGPTLSRAVVKACSESSLKSEVGY
jgi:hypothetical protein